MTMAEECIDESNQMLVVVVDVNPNQLLFARSPGMIITLETTEKFKHENV